MIFPRRSGKDIVAFNIAVRRCLLSTCAIFYIFPTYKAAKRIIWDAITNDGKRLIDWYCPDELVYKKNSSELKIEFKNGSILRLVGSNRYNDLVGSNYQGCIYSEYAVQDPNAYLYLSPIAEANNAFTLIISCVSPDTLVITDQGLSRIENVSPARSEYSELNKPIFGLNGFHNAEQFYYGGLQNTLKIQLQSGYTLECTPIHKIWNGTQWIQSKDLKVGDLIPVQYGQNIWGCGPNIKGFTYNSSYPIQNYMPLSVLDEDFFYLLGLIHADGNYNQNAVCITKKKNIEIIEFIRSVGFKTRSDGIHHVYSSRFFCSFLEYLGFKHGACNKTFPDKLFSCTRSQMKNFIQGIFDGDGTSSSDIKHRGAIKYTSTNLSFIKDLQVILLNLGIVSSIRTEHKKPTKKVPVESTIYNLEICGYFAHVFYNEIGFRVKYKQDNSKYITERCKTGSGNIYPIDKQELINNKVPLYILSNPEKITRRNLEELQQTYPNKYLETVLHEQFYYSPIKSIEESQANVFDFVIPETHSFFSNGFISHNTPRGHNWMYELYNRALHNPDWYVSKLTVDDTGHISPEKIQKIRDEGIMSEDLIQQEYFTSFDLGIEGSYYCKLMDAARREDRITMVPYDPSYKVNTSWDLGVDDQTCIVFAQVCNNIVRIIDYYENSGKGLDHYAQVIHSKGYVYNKHLAPHDIMVREWAGGAQTRLDKARQLGINFTVAPKVPLADGIEAVKTMLAKTWFDEIKAKRLIQALENYRREYNPVTQKYNDHPYHDWSSDAADAFRMLAISIKRLSIGTSAADLDERYNKVMMNSNSIPKVFSNEPY